jgi:hypothetical protein
MKTIQLELQVHAIDRPEGISDDDWEWVAALKTLKIAAGYMYLAVFQDKDDWRVYGYLHKGGLSPYYVTRSSEREARSFIEQTFPEATHAHSLAFMAAPSFRALYRWGEGKVDVRQGHEC